MAWRYVQMRFPSAGANGRSRARAPVATIICLALSLSSPFSPLTVSEVGPVSVPSPIWTVILFFFIRRSEEHTSELQSLMRISYAVFCLKKQKTKNHHCTQQTTEHIKQRNTNNNH